MENPWKGFKLAYKTKYAQQTWKQVHEIEDALDALIKPQTLVWEN